MNRNLLLLTSFSSLLLLPSCGGSKHTHAGSAGTFMKAPVTIDGDDAEWPSPYPYYDSKAKISYAVANDGDNLYLTIKASDQQIQRKIMRGGLKTWIDTSGRKEEVTMINYPIKQNGRPDMPDEAKGRRGNEEGRPPMPARDSTARKRPPMVFSLDLSLAGFADGNGNFTISKSNPNDVLIRMNTNAYDELVWEAAIPLKSLYPAASAHLLAGKPLSVCFEIGGMALPARDVTHQHEGHEGGGGGMGGGGGRGGMGGGGGMGHGGHGGGQGGENGDQELLTQTTRTWVKTSIAQ